MRMRLNAVELSNILGCSQSAATKLIAKMNTELKAQGYLVIRGSVPSKYAYERLYIKEIETTGDLNYDKQNQN